MSEEKPAAPVPAKPMESGAGVRAFVPSNSSEVRAVAKMMFDSGMAPPSLNSVDKVAFVILFGLELGLKPVAAVNRVAVINGRPCLWGSGIPAILLAKRFKIEEFFVGEFPEAGQQNDAFKAVCRITRPDTGQTIEREYSIGDAKRAGLWDERKRVTRKSREGGTYETDNDAPWFKHPKRMLQMRARGQCSQDAAGDVLAGTYIADEEQDLEMLRDVTPEETPKQSITERMVAAKELEKKGKVDDAVLIPDMDSAAFAEGVSAQKDGHPASANPYHAINEAQACIDWMAGHAAMAKAAVGTSRE